MPRSVAVALSVEFLLVVVTILLLVRPDFLFRDVSAKKNVVAKWVGVLFLALTFCWSVIFGIMLSLNNLSIRI